MHLARDEQLPPDGDWTTWLILAGRGSGKTRTGSETIRDWVETGRCKRIVLVGRSAADVRDVMVGGESGLISVCQPGFRPLYEPSKRRLTWPNGAIATTFSADEPDQLRGPQCDGAWADELAAWRFPDAWNQLLFGLRLGADPRVIVTTTPRPTKLIRALAADPTTHVTTGSTYDNQANLAPTFLRQVVARFEGTRLGRQELGGEILSDNPGALWRLEDIDKARCDAADVPDMRRVVVAIDPAVSSNPESDETGIVVVGISRDGKGYVLDDGSGKYTPDGWARKAIELFDKHKADAVVGETNQGGDLVEHNVRTVRSNVRFIGVRATRGKEVRAEPVAALYEQGKISHVGVLATLEDQLTGWDPAAGTGSPDRLDALVWGLSELFVLGPHAAKFSASPAGRSRWAR